MWIIFGAFSMLTDGIGTVYDKKHMEQYKKPSLGKVAVVEGVLYTLVMCLLYAFDLSETGTAPWTILFNHPVYALCAVFNILYILTFFASLYFIASPLATSIDTINTAFVLVGMSVIYVSRGLFTEITDLLNPIKIVLIILILGIAAVIPFTEAKVKQDEKVGAKTKRGMTFVGILLALVFTFFDAADSLVMDYFMSAEEADSVDFLISSFFMVALFGLFTWIVLTVKNKRVYNVFTKNDKNVWVGGLGDVLSTVFYCIAAMDNAVMLEMIWIAYPGLYLVFNRLFAKEKLSQKQWICAISLIVLTTVLCLI